MESLRVDQRAAEGRVVDVDVAVGLGAGCPPVLVRIAVDPVEDDPLFVQVADRVVEIAAPPGALARMVKRISLAPWLCSRFSQTIAPGTGGPISG
jgi:hypothetical protein